MQDQRIYSTCNLPHASHSLFCICRIRIVGNIFLYSRLSSRFYLHLYVINTRYKICCIVVGGALLLLLFSFCFSLQLTLVQRKYLNSSTIFSQLYNLSRFELNQHMPMVGVWRPILYFKAYRIQLKYRHVNRF